MMMQCEMCYLGNERHPTMKTSKKYIVGLYSVPCYDLVLKQLLRPFIKAVRTIMITMTKKMTIMIMLTITIGQNDD